MKMDANFLVEHTRASEYIRYADHGSYVNIEYAPFEKGHILSSWDGLNKMSKNFMSCIADVISGLNTKGERCIYLGHIGSEIVDDSCLQVREQFIREYSQLLRSIKNQAQVNTLSVALVGSSIIASDKTTQQRYVKQLAILSYLKKRYLGLSSVLYVDAPVHRTQEEIQQFQIRSNGGKNLNYISTDLTHVYINPPLNRITIEHMNTHQPKQIELPEYNEMVESQMKWVQQNVVQFCD